ncbi:MAG: ATP-binding protein [Desulfobacterales bacterium]|nr:ATP-binding protein [Desulfobacterales bacterium]
MKNVLKRIIKDFHNRPLPDFKPRHADVPLNLDKIITIVGPRRAGKTYYLYQLMAELERQSVVPNQILYVNFEDERLELEGRHDLIIEAYLELYPELDLSLSYFFFDEIQELDQWEKFVRRMFDTVTKNIFLTGSNARLLSREIATSLRGRSLSFEIMPLSFKEFLSFKDIDEQDIYSTRNISLIQNALEEYLLWGGYPELVGIEDRFKPQVLQEYFNVMLYRDLVERYTIRDVSVLKYLIKRLIASFTKEFSVNKLYNELRSRGISISKDRIYRIVDQIFSIYMLAYVEKHDPSVTKREMSNKKIYLYDNGFAAVTQYSFFEDRGKLLENLVFASLRAQTDEIYFLKNGWECDFLVFPSTKQPLVIQVTERPDSDNLNREIKGLEMARKRVLNCKCLLLAGEVDQAVDLPDWCNVMPISTWLLE